MAEECDMAKDILGWYNRIVNINIQHSYFPVFVVDRFYSSTCGYTIGKATVGDLESIDNLVEKDQELVRWPLNLLKPALCIILKIGESIFRMLLYRLIVNTSRWRNKKKARQ